ncbi:hypothetical protein ACT7C1_25390 [Bacillus paranthracis]|uniref:Uncharacterized protein n=1 Tax=Bacillus cereus TaxID=1396 RepID=A0A9X6GCM8_BACCE|nr:hypothetical protein [Bacillus cereus]OOR71475.1 hypothetical protein BLX06_30535 [Bacillus cereus]
MGASPQECNVTTYRVSLFHRTIEQSGSAGTIANPSRMHKFLVFGLIGLAKENPLPKKVRQGQEKKL